MYLCILIEFHFVFVTCDGGKSVISLFNILVKEITLYTYFPLIAFAHASSLIEAQNVFIKFYAEICGQCCRSHETKIPTHVHDSLQSSLVPV